MVSLGGGLVQMAGGWCNSCSTARLRNWDEAFLLRDLSATRTLGGGLLDLRPPARRAAEERRATQRRWRNRPRPRCKSCSTPRRILSISTVFCATARSVMGRSFRARRSLARPRAIFCRPSSTRRWRNIERLAGFAPQSRPSGHGTRALRLALRPRLPKPGFAALLREAAAAGQVALDGGFARLPFIPQMSAEGRDAVFAHRSGARGRTRFRPPRVRDLAAETGVDEREIRRMMKFAARLGRVDQIAQDHFFLRETTAEMAEMVRALSDDADGGWFTAPAFRDRTRNGRKVAIQILDFFDRVGLTLRRGDLRRVNPHRAELF